MTRAEIPAPGVDSSPGAAALQISLTGFGSDYVRLSSSAPDAIVISRGAPVLVDGRMRIELKVLRLSMSGVSPVFGRVDLEVHPTQQGQGAILLSADGTDVPAPAALFVHVILTFPDLGFAVTTHDPLAIYLDSLDVYATLDSIPIRQIFKTESRFGLPGLFRHPSNGGNGNLVGVITYAAIDFNPSIDCLDTRARLAWNLGLGDESIDLSGRTVLIRSEAFTPPDGRAQAAAEIYSMDLSGHSNLWGPVRVSERGELISPGVTQAILPGTPFPAESVFRLLLRFEFDSGLLPPLVNREPVAAAATVDALPPLGSEYRWQGRIPLSSPSNPEISGELQSLAWTWGAGQNCCVDADKDGSFAPPCDDDCDDTDPLVSPFQREDCANGRDDDCDGQPDCLDRLCAEAACDDLNGCTTDDRCDGAGGCVGQPLVCSDSDPCTADRCDPAVGQCVYTPLPTPGEIGPVRVGPLGAIQWGAVPEAVVYNTYRGRIPPIGGMRANPEGPYTHACFESADAQGNGATLTMDTGVPPLGEARYYLVNGESGCEGPLGKASDGTPRPNPFPCPTPPP